jgi:hypothetical protein
VDDRSVSDIHQRLDYQLGSMKDSGVYDNSMIVLAADRDNHRCRRVDYNAGS